MAGKPSITQLWWLVHGPATIFLLAWNIGWLMVSLYLIVAASHPHSDIVRFFLLLPAALILWLGLHPRTDLKD